MTSKLLKLAFVGMILSIILAACQPAPATQATTEATQAQTQAATTEATQAPTMAATTEATQAPTTAPTEAFTGTNLTGDCTQQGGSEVSKIEATDANTVVF